MVVAERKPMIMLAEKAGNPPKMVKDWLNGEVKPAQLWRGVGAGPLAGVILTQLTWPYTGVRGKVDND
jgi:hypothetical protein